MLTAGGHREVEYVRDDDEIAAYGLMEKATVALRAVWAWDSYREIRRLLQKETPDIAHFYNTFTLVSPGAYYACREADVPVVQTLRKYRIRGVRKGRESALLVCH